MLGHLTTRYRPFIVLHSITLVNRSGYKFIAPDHSLIPSYEYLNTNHHMMQTDLTIALLNCNLLSFQDETSDQRPTD